MQLVTETLCMSAVGNTRLAAREFVQPIAISEIENGLIDRFADLHPDV
jgi:hypothetical protein